MRFSSCAADSRELRFRGLSRLERFSFDAAYVQRLAAGDPDTEDHFTRYFGELLRMKLRSRLRSPALVEDAQQETFVRVLTTLKERGGLTRPEGLGAFVNSVCNNVLFELYRAQAKASPADEALARDVAAEAPSVESGLLDEEERARVRDALAAMPRKEQELLTALFFDERDKDALCRELHVNRVYLRVLLHRAKARFKARLEAAAR